MSGYTPIFSSIFKGTLCGRWPDTGVWLCLLAMADKDGKIDATIPYISAITGIPADVLTDCIERFLAPDPQSRTQTDDGRRLSLIDPERPWGWLVVNHGRYREKARKQMQQIAATESGRDAERKRVERDKKKSMSGGVQSCPVVSGSDRLSDSDSDSDSDSEQDSRRAASGGSEKRTLDQALFVEAREIFGKSIGGQINRAIRDRGKPWVVGVIEACRGKDQEAAKAYLAAAINGVKKPDQAEQRKAIP